MRVLVATVALATILAVSTSASAVSPTRFCGTATYGSGQGFSVFVSGHVSCAFAKHNARAVALRHRCAKGWRFSLSAPNKNGICVRKGRFYFALANS